MASTASSTSFRAAESLDFSLLLIDKPQRSPWHIRVMWPNPSVDLRFAVCMKRIDVGNFKHTLLLGNTHTVASFWVVMLVPVFWLLRTVEAKNSGYIPSLRAVSSRKSHDWRPK